MLGLVKQEDIWMTISRFTRPTLAVAAAMLLGTSALVNAQEEQNASAAQTDVEEQEDAAAPGPETASSEEGKILVEREKITDRQHPDYVRCRSERVVGSLAKRTRTCMTNREWRRVAAEGNKRANELVDEMRATSLPGG
jgi:hypothetical protein